MSCHTLLFIFRSGTCGLNEELGKHRGREGNKECELCGNECESVSHVLWECSAYSSSRADFLLKLQERLGKGFERFDALDIPVRKKIKGESLCAS